MAARVLALVALASLWVAAPAAAQAPAPNGELGAMIDVIEDDARERLIREMRQIVAAANDEAAAEGLGAESPVAATDRSLLGDAVARLTGRLADLATAIGNPAGAGVWLGAQFTEAERRALWASFGIHTAAAAAGGWVLALLARLGVAGAVRRIEAREAPTWVVRVPVAFGRFLLVALPAAVFAVAGAAIIAVLAPEPAVRQGALALVVAVTAAWLGVALARATLAPFVPALRPVPLEDGTAVYLFIWARRLIVIVVGSLFLVEAAGDLGVPAAGTLVLTKGLGLIVALVVVALILQTREAVRAWIAGAEDPRPGLSRPRLFRARLGDVWHVLAILYVTAAWGSWTTDVPGGFATIAGNGGKTAGIAALAWLAAWATGRALGRLFGVGQEIRRRYPFVAERADLYLPLVHRVVTTVIVVAAMLAILQIWGVDVLAWAGSDVGRDLTARAINIAVILAIALLAWEAASAAIRIALERTGEDGQELVRSQRARTLLPLIRNALLVVIGVMTGMVVLAELGVSIGPLLAGAGVAGLAVGFGAQTLVQDFITGLFILFEDTVHVGDVIRAGGKAGTVEALTVRTVRLRDLSGTVHTVPFSAVDIIENMTKEFSQAVIYVGVGYRENYDDVVEVLKGIGEDLAGDEDFGPSILEPMQVLGLNELADSAVVILVRFKVQPASQWSVRREFNRRVKARFDELGIEIPYPHRTLYFGEDRQGSAPPLRHKPAPEDGD